METAHYTIDIEAPRQQVWDYMLGKETYPKWSTVAWPGSTNEGEWKEGAEMRFVGGSDGGGTLARFTLIDAPNKLQAEHIAVLQAGGVRDTTSDIAREWIGAREEYELVSTNGKTKVNVSITVAPAWREEFDNSWPVALQALKEQVEAS